jgi:ankyrin repeat protein
MHCTAVHKLLTIYRFLCSVILFFNPFIFLFIQVACKTAELWFFWHCRPETLASASAKTEKMEPRHFPPIIIAKRLLEAGADPQEATLLPAAVNFCAVEVLKVSSLPGNNTAIQLNHSSFYHSVIVKKNFFLTFVFQLSQEFLELGMDVNMLDDNQRTPLGCACTSGNVPTHVVALLLEHGANVNKGGGWRKHKPLIFAYVHNSVDKVG